MKRGIGGKIAAWLALAALLFNTVSPFAASANPPGIPQEICSANAAKYSGHDPSKPPAGEHGSRHCSLCLPSGHGALATPPNFSWQARWRKPTPGKLEAGPEPTQRTFLQHRAQPRAPPRYA